MDEHARTLRNRVKGGVLCRRSEPLTRSGACRIPRRSSEALGSYRIATGEGSSSIGQCAMWSKLVVQLGYKTPIKPAFEKCIIAGIHGMGNQYAFEAKRDEAGV